MTVNRLPQKCSRAYRLETSDRRLTTGRLSDSPPELLLPGLSPNNRWGQTQTVPDTVYAHFQQHLGQQGDPAAAVTAPLQRPLVLLAHFAIPQGSLVTSRLLKTKSFQPVRSNPESEIEKIQVAPRTH